MDAPKFKRDFAREMKGDEYLFLAKPDHPNAPEPYEIPESGVIYTAGGMIKVQDFEPQNDPEKAADYFYRIASPFDPEWAQSIAPISQKFVECMELLLRESVVDIRVPTKFFLYQWNFSAIEKHDLLRDEGDENGLPVKYVTFRIIAPDYLAGNAIQNLNSLANSQRSSIHPEITHPLARNRFSITLNGPAPELINESVFRKDGVLSSVGGFLDTNNAILYFTDPVMHAGARRVLGLDKSRRPAHRKPQPPTPSGEEAQP